MMQWDADGDGRITREEAPDFMKDRFERMDTDGDGFVDSDEVEAMAERMGRGRGGRRPGGE